MAASGALSVTTRVAAGADMLPTALRCDGAHARDAVATRALHAAEAISTAVREIAKHVGVSSAVSG